MNEGSSLATLSTGLRSKSAYSRDPDGDGWLKDETGRPIAVRGWVANATNRHGRWIGCGAFETAEEVAGDLRRWEDLQ
jgi:hypothetical protein